LLLTSVTQESKAVVDHPKCEVTKLLAASYLKNMCMAKAIIFIPLPKKCSNSLGSTSVYITTRIAQTVKDQATGWKI
jgi:hypothetical protein